MTPAGRSQLRLADLPGNDYVLEEPLIFVACAPDRCLGNFACVDGYTGVQCFECEPGQFYWQGTCNTPCHDIHVNDSPALITVFGILAVVLVWVVLNKSAYCLFVASVENRVVIDNDSPFISI